MRPFKAFLFPRRIAAYTLTRTPEKYFSELWMDYATSTSQGNKDPVRGWCVKFVILAQKEAILDFLLSK